jgi:hypothetical protein
MLNYNIELTNLNNGYKKIIELPIKERILKETMESFIYSNWEWSCFYPDNIFKTISCLNNGNLLNINRNLITLSERFIDDDYISYTYTKGD